MENISGSPDASEALSAVAAARSRLAERLYTPWWYHPLLGLLLGLTVLQLGSVFGRTGLLLGVVPVLGFLGMGFVYRRLSGVDLYGEDAPDGGARARSALALLVCGLIICAACSYLLGTVLGWAWAPWALAVVVLVAITGVGRSYDGMLRAQLRGPLP